MKHETGKGIVKMDYEEFKAKVIKIHETYGNWSHGECRKLIPEIELTERDKSILAKGPVAAGADVEYWTKRMTKDYQENYFDKWMASLKDECKAAIERHRTAETAAWNALSSEEKAAREEAERKFQCECHEATAKALAQYYEEAARTGRYTGD